MDNEEINIDRIIKLTENVNSFINFENEYKRNELKENQRDKFEKLHACLGTLITTLCSIRYYLNTNKLDNYNSEMSFIYGVMQSLFTQQDALIDIHGIVFPEPKIDESSESKKTKACKNNHKYVISKYPELNKIRGYRNDLLHPTNINDEEVGKCYLKFPYIEDYIIKYEKYILNTKSSKRIRIDIKEIIKQQLDILNKVLNEILNTWENEYNKFINQFNGKKTSSLFNKIGFYKYQILKNNAKEITYNKANLYIKDLIKRLEVELDDRYYTWKNNKAFTDFFNKYKLINTLLEEINKNILTNNNIKLRKYIYEILFNLLDNFKEIAKDVDVRFKQEKYKEDNSNHLLKKQVKTLLDNNILKLDVKSPKYYFNKEKENDYVKILKSNINHKDSTIIMHIKCPNEISDSILIRTIKQKIININYLEIKLKEMFYADLNKNFILSLINDIQELYKFIILFLEDKTFNYKIKNEIIFNLYELMYKKVGLLAEYCIAINDYFEGNGDIFFEDIKNDEEIQL